MAFQNQLQLLRPKACGGRRIRQAAELQAAADVSVALEWAVVVLVVTLLIIGYLAIRRLELPFRYKAMIAFVGVGSGPTPTRPKETAC
ncbi:hypothetical protein [Arthrobacter sp. U41]|uniref:hypothetical protein n=1 Tax=Arthrobacter sp. U41 TaxID=1849032 RepID=UPI00085956BE|nr:hypothetical protein [Arthrobacter sp. U41]AOT05942.1 hypothetical protein ASPU41_21090 [Arthrobacter sp. U41]AOT06009.1 hypothetical protein ASPU41_21515 [Arthrobacter sp. U41]